MTSKAVIPDPAGAGRGPPNAAAPGDDQSSCLEFLLRQRQLNNAAVLTGLVAIVGIAFSIFHLYAAYFGQGERA